MTTIWKFSIEIKKRVVVNMPKDAEILCVQTQFNEPEIWAMVNPESEILQARLFEVFGTGHEMKDVMFGYKRKYIGTFQTDAGNYVFHVFENVRI